MNVRDFIHETEAALVDARMNESDDTGPWPKWQIDIARSLGFSDEELAQLEVGIL